MNIALFASAFYPSLGGVEELVRQLAHAQRRRGDSNLIFTNRWPKDLPETEVYEGLPVRRYVFRVPEPNWKQLGGSILYGPLTLRRICAEVQSLGADVLHVQCVSSNAYYALNASQRLGLPLVATLQGELTMDANAVFQRSAFARDMMRDVLANADAITACSGQTLAEAEEFYGKPFGSRARVVYNGISLNDFENVTPFEHGRSYILGIGRHVPQKGFDVLIRAFAASVKSGDLTHDLIIAGDGADRQSLELLAHDLGVDARVRFVGRVERPAAVRLFAGCSFFVLPSRHEPMGIVNLEAMAAGKAVIATKVGGVPELVKNDVTGLLVPPDDVDALHSAINALISDPSLRARLGQAGAAKARKFDWDEIAGQYAEVYTGVCRRGLQPA